MNVIGTVVQIATDTSIKKKDGSTYQGWKIVYEDDDGEVKTIAKHANSLKYNAALANGLKELSAGDEFTLEMVKENDFWNPKSIYKGKVAPAASTSEPSKGSNKTPSGGGSSYPTKEERAATQMQIIRQSSLGHAVNLAGVQGSKKVSARDIIATAQEFVLYVTTGEVGLTAKSTSVEDMDDDIPL